LAGERRSPQPAGLLWRLGWAEGQEGCVHITTSTYTQQAMDFARSVEGIVLIDGQRLASRMIDCELGVSARTVEIPKIDGDYFDEESN
jgi:restriction endonuclease Mrr